MSGSTLTKNPPAQDSNDQQAVDKDDPRLISKTQYAEKVAAKSPSPTTAVSDAQAVINVQVGRDLAVPQDVYNKLEAAKHNLALAQQHIQNVDHKQEPSTLPTRPNATKHLTLQWDTSNPDDKWWVVTEELERANRIADERGCDWTDLKESEVPKEIMYATGLRMQQEKQAVNLDNT